MNSKSLLKTAAIATVGAVCIAFSSTKAGHAATIDTTPSWDGSEGFGYFGDGSTATVGQTFTVGTDNVLQNFSFRLGGSGGQGTVDFAAYVMQWDGAKATGPILYQSGQQSKDAGNLSFQVFSFNTAGIPLTSGYEYVAFLSASNFYSGNLNYTQLGSVSSDPYPGGLLVYNNSGNNFNNVTLNNWQIQYTSTDAVFTASFSDGAAVIPTPALLPGLLGIGIAALRKRKAEAGMAEES